VKEWHKATDNTRHGEFLTFFCSQVYSIVSGENRRRKYIGLWPVNFQQNGACEVTNFTGLRCTSSSETDVLDR